MAKTREPDKLAKDAMEAKKAGMSYGQWMAKHYVPPTPKQHRFEPVRCVCCGELIFPTNKAVRKFCSEYCNSKYQSMKRKEAHELSEMQQLSSDCD